MYVIISEVSETGRACDFNARLLFLQPSRIHFKNLLPYVILNIRTYHICITLDNKHLEGLIMTKKYIPEPFRIKAVEPLTILTREEREAKIKEAKYNLFNLKGEDCYIDLLTDSGTNAMSQEQWAGIMRGDEAYAGASSYYKLMDAGKDIFGYEYIQPVHQGRAAEKVLLPLFLSEGKYAISNMFFDTTRAHVILAGARPIDCVVPEAKEPKKKAKFKGNMDVVKMEQCIKGKRCGKHRACSDDHHQ